MLSLSNHLHPRSKLQRKQQNMEWKQLELIAISEQNYKATVECSVLECLKMRSFEARFQKWAQGNSMPQDATTFHRYLPTNCMEASGCEFRSTAKGSSRVRYLKVVPLLRGNHPVIHRPFDHSGNVAFPLPCGQHPVEPAIERTLRHSNPVTRASTEYFVNTGATAATVVHSSFVPAEAPGDVTPTNSFLISHHAGAIGHPSSDSSLSLSGQPVSQVATKAAAQLAKASPITPASLQPQLGIAAASTGHKTLRQALGQSITCTAPPITNLR